MNKLQEGVLSTAYNGTSLSRYRRRNGGSGSRGCGGSGGGGNDGGCGGPSGIPGGADGSDNPAAPSPLLFRPGADTPRGAGGGAGGDGGRHRAQAGSSASVSPLQSLSKPSLHRSYVSSPRGLFLHTVMVAPVSFWLIKRTTRPLPYVMSVQVELSAPGCRRACKNVSWASDWDVPSYLHDVYTHTHTHAHTHTHTHTCQCHCL